MDGNVTVEDLGSKNGTALEDRRSGKTRTLRPGVTAYLTKRRRVRLSGGITLELSGRRSPLAGDGKDDLFARTDPGFVRQTIAGY